jgi:predicted metal-dependent hydrolase
VPDQSRSAHADLPFEEAYREGVRLFNAGQYWHAHEQWEICWRASGEPDADFYKGLIQAAAALVHWQRGNPRGLHLNWAKARPRIVALGQSYRSLKIGMFLEAMDRFVLADGSLLVPTLMWVND